jgi:hypothetical protein
MRIRGNCLKGSGYRVQEKKAETLLPILEGILNPEPSSPERGFSLNGLTS